MNGRSSLASFCAVMVPLVLVACFPRQTETAGQAVYRVPPEPPKARYVIDGRLDPEKGIFEGRESVTVTNNTALAIRVVAFDWPAGAPGPTESGAPGSTIEVALGGLKLAPKTPSEAQPEKAPAPLVFFDLPTAVRPGTKFELDVAFTLRFNPNPEPGGTSKWYPRLWWDGILQHDTYSVKLNVPEGFVLATSGRLDPETGRYETAGAKTFGVYLAKNMRTASREVDGVLITSLFTEKGAQAAAICLETAADAVKFYKDWLGFYPFASLTIVPGGPGRWGGYPMATGIVAIHGLETYKDGESLQHWQHITSHEIGHEYWGDWVIDGDKPDWLWICMGIYADTNYMTTRGFDPERMIHWTANYLMAIPAYYDMTLDIPPAWEDRVHYDRNNTVIHSKGPALVFALESVLGREAFERIYKKALRDFGGRRFGWRAFEALCEAETGQNLEWFFDAWVRGNQYLCYAIEAKDCRPEGDAFRTSIRVRRLGTMAMPVPVKAMFEDGTAQLLQTDRAREVDEVVFSSRARLKEAVLNPDRKLAMVDKPLAKITDAAATALAFGWERAQSLRVFQSVSGESIPSADVWHRLGYDLYWTGHFPEAQTCFAKMSAVAGVPPLMKFAAECWLGLLADLAKRRPEALGHYRRALELYTGEAMNYGVAGLDMDKAWVEARLETPFVR